MQSSQPPIKLWSLKLSQIFNCYHEAKLPEPIRDYFATDNCDEIYLEIGNSSAGLKHIMERHEKQFLIPELKDLLNDDDDDENDNNKNDLNVKDEKKLNNDAYGEENVKEVEGKNDEVLVGNEGMTNCLISVSEEMDELSSIIKIDRNDDNINNNIKEINHEEKLENSKKNENDSIPLERKYQIVSEYIYNIMKNSEYYYYGYKILPGKKIPERVTLALLYQLDFNKFLRVSMGTNGFIVTAVPQNINNYVHTSSC